VSVGSVLLAGSSDSSTLGRLLERGRALVEWRQTRQLVDSQYIFMMVGYLDFTIPVCRTERDARCSTHTLSH
jgi:hypothetical protein